MSEFFVKTGPELSEQDLKDIFALDELVYTEEATEIADMVGVIDNMLARHEFCNDNFVAVFERFSGKLAGYINYLNINSGLFDEVLNSSDSFPDDDILPDRLVPFNKEENHLFIISLAIHHEFRDSGAVKVLSEAWLNELRTKRAEGYPITDISACTIGPDGEKFSKTHGFRLHHRLTESREALYICDEMLVDALLDKGPYIKTYHDDVYIMIPLADHVLNRRLDNVYLKDIPDEAGHCNRDTYFIRPAFDDKGNIKPAPNSPVNGIPFEYIPDTARSFICDMRDNYIFECANQVNEEIECAYLGAFSLLVTVDSAYTEAEETVMGELTAYGVLHSHRATHMHILNLIIPDCRYSTSQLQDQFSWGYVKIRANDSQPPVYEDLYQCLKNGYGLHRCGEAKTLMCASSKPEQLELMQILSAETMHSVQVDYKILPDEKKLNLKNMAQYDYYELYLSDKAIFFVMNDYSDDFEERVETIATYAFIAELVMFQNIALEKVNTRITDALTEDGDVSHEQILELYKEFGRTVRFWDNDNYKYKGARAEADCILEAFKNEESYDSYREHQVYLENIVGLKSAISDGYSSSVLNIVATLLAVISIQPFIEELLIKFYGFIGVEDIAVHVSQTFNTGLFGGAAAVFIILILQRRRRRNADTARRKG